MVTHGLSPFLRPEQVPTLEVFQEIGLLLMC